MVYTLLTIGLVINWRQGYDRHRSEAYNSKKKSRAASVVFNPGLNMNGLGLILMIQMVLRRYLL